jgi:hypothetical protein
LYIDTTYRPTHTSINILDDKVEINELSLKPMLIDCITMIGELDYILNPSHSAVLVMLLVKYNSRAAKQF